MTKIDVMQMACRLEPAEKRIEQPDRRKTGFGELLRDKRPMDYGGGTGSEKASSAKEKESVKDEKDCETTGRVPDDSRLTELIQSQLLAMALLQEDKNVQAGEWLQSAGTEEAEGHIGETLPVEPAAPNPEVLPMQTGETREEVPTAAGMETMQLPMEAGLEESGVKGEAGAAEQIKSWKASEAADVPTQENHTSKTGEKPVQESVEPPSAGKGHTEQSEADNREGEQTLARGGDSGGSMASAGAAQAQHTAFRENTESFTAIPENPGTSGLIKTTPADLPADLGKNLAARMPGKNGTLTIELEPASLGKVLVKVVYEAGRASVSLMAANPKTLEILSRNAGEIAGILESRTGQETVIYTAPPESQYSESEREGRGERREREQQEQGKRKNQSDSFAQQLRLGLV